MENDTLTTVDNNGENVIESLQSRYNRLHTAYIAQGMELAALKYPVRSAEQRDMDLLAARTFILSMPPAEGAVTCAGVYGRQFFDRDRDTAFLKPLCELLTTRFDSHQALIQSTFNIWTKHV